MEVYLVIGRKIRLLFTTAILAGASEAGAQERTVTLEDAITLALRTQPAIIQAQGDLDVAHAGQREAIGSFLPTLSVSSGVSQNSTQRFNPTTQSFQSGSSGVAYSAGLSASLEVFDGFRRLSQTHSAGATSASADASLTNQRFQVILLTKQAFFNALSSAELVRVAQQQVKRSQQQLRVSKDKLAAGSAIRSDTLRATVDVGNATLQLLNAQAQLATAEANLARMIGADGSVQATGSPPLPDVAALDTTALRQEVLRAAPSVKAAEAQARAAGAQVGVTRAQYFPSMTLSYSPSWAATDSTAHIPSGVVSWPSLRNTWSVRLGLSWPIFNGFSRETNLARSLSGRDAAEAKAADSRRQANAQFTQQFAALRAAGQQLTIAEASRAAADEDLRVQQERYRLGSATIVDVLTSQVNLDQAEVNLVQARLNVLVAKAQIEALVGREL
jgi:outer membrane protein TolC